MKCYSVFLLLMVTVCYSSHCPHKPSISKFEIDFPENLNKSLLLKRRIISGTRAKPGQFPWQASIIYKKGKDKGLCGGSLIAPRWILTAGHCVFGASHFSIQLGSTERFDEDSRGGTVKTVSRTSIIHENYNNFNLNNDIALIDIGKKVATNAMIKEIRLPSKGEVLGVDVNVEVSGWGITKDNTDDVSSHLNYVKVKTISNEGCAKTYGSQVVINTTVCTLGQITQSTCIGDSGGGLVYRPPNRKPVLVGIVSFVSKSGCEKRSPAAFTRTEPYLDWISKHTGIKVS